MFSIIIPNFNRADVIEMAIKSVLTQTFKNFELIIIDDCSTDNSLEVISSLEDERIKIFKLEKNYGAAAARNFGIKNSSGQFISFLDSDDYFEPRFLEISNKMLLNTESSVGFMWTGIRLHYKYKTVESSWQPKIKRNPYITFLYEHKVGTGSGVTIKREVFQKCGFFNEQLKAAEDTEFFLRITKVFNFNYTNKILVNVQKTQKDRISTNYKNIGLAYNLFIQDHLTEIEKDRVLRMKYYYKLMWLNFYIVDKKKARYYLRKIPYSNFGFFLKSLFLYCLYELFQLETANQLHKKFYGLNNGKNGF